MALISVPLSCALAISSGADPMSGLLSASYGPLMGGLFGGSNYNILGPAGALVNILNSLSFEYGPEILPYIAIGSGIIFMAVYFLKIE